MRKIFFWLLLIGFGIHLDGGLLEAKVYIDIRSPSFRKFPIAIRTFDDPLLPSTEMRLGLRATEILRSDLDISGFFTLIESPGGRGTGGTAGSSRPLAESGRGPMETERIDFHPWAQEGAEALVLGRMFYQNRSLTLEARLYDVVKKEMIIGKRYVGEITDLSRMVHRFADEIIFAITGELGFFQTKIVYVSKASGNKELYLMDFDGRNVIQFTHHKSICLSPRSSPDGRTIAFTSYKSGNPDVYLKDLRNGEERRISSHPGLNISPAWSPDGKRLAVTLSKDGNPEIYTMNIDGSALTRLTQNAAIDVSPTWSPDGQRIAFVSNRGGSPQIYIMEANGKNVQRLTFTGNYNTHPAWSPRGDRIVFDAAMEGTREIVIIRPDGSNSRVLTANMNRCEMPSWSPDGRHVLFSSTRDGGPNLYMVDAEGTRIKRLTFQRGGDTYPTWLPRFRE